MEQIHRGDDRKDRRKPDGQQQQRAQQLAHKVKLHAD